MEVVLEGLGLVAHAVSGAEWRECISEDDQAKVDRTTYYLQAKQDSCDSLSTSNNWKACIRADRRDRPDRKLYLH